MDNNDIYFKEKYLLYKKKYILLKLQNSGAPIKNREDIINKNIQKFLDSCKKYNLTFPPLIEKFIKWRDDNNYIFKMLDNIDSFKIYLVKLLKQKKNSKSEFIPTKERIISNNNNIENLKRLIKWFILKTRYFMKDDVMLEKYNEIDAKKTKIPNQLPISKNIKARDEEIDYYICLVNSTNFKDLYNKNSSISDLGRDININIKYYKYYKLYDKNSKKKHKHKYINFCDEIGRLFNQFKSDDYLYNSLIYLDVNDKKKVEEFIVGFFDHIQSESSFEV